MSTRSLRRKAKIQKLKALLTKKVYPVGIIMNKRILQCKKVIVNKEKSQKKGKAKFRC